jgi:hypothetical protein
VANSVAGTLSGPAGKIDVRGIEIKGFTHDATYCLLITSLPSAADMNKLSESQRILAGERFVVRATGRSMSMDEAIAAGATNLGAEATDLSTIYCDVPTGPGAAPPGSQPDWDCVALALKIYRQALADAQKAHDSCCEAALAAFVLCMASSYYAIAVPLLGYAWMAECVVGLCIWLQNCDDTYTGAANAALGSLQMSLLSCGINIVGD